MSLNRRHAGGIKSAMENLKKIDARIAASASTNPSGVESTPDYSGSRCSVLTWADMGLSANDRRIIRDRLTAREESDYCAADIRDADEMTRRTRARQQARDMQDWYLV